MNTNLDEQPKNQINIDDIAHPEILLKEIKEKIVSKTSNSYDLNFIFAKFVKNINKIHYKIEKN